MKILIIEDNEKMASLLKKGFEREGFTADYLTDGEAGERHLLMNHQDYDVVVLDLMMPKKSGYEVCEDIRKAKISTPIIVLTAKDSVEDKITLLNLGADDYMVKPFSFEELLARVRALLRRPEETLPVILEAGPLVLNSTTRKVACKGKDIPLTLKEFALLEFLMRNPNAIVEREKIITSIWDFDVDVFNNVVDVYINKLRNKIDGDRRSNLIETVRGIGYRLNV
jgi:DNA-binding response OmpR family regulator